MIDEPLPFRNVLDQLFGADEVPLSLIYYLSDMSASNFALFAEEWPAQPVQRRRVIGRHMADICEANFTVDFSPAFRILLADPAPEVRLAALDGLWDSSNVTVVRPVINMMKGDDDPRVRAAAAATLGHYVLMGEWGQVSRSVADRIVAALLDVYQDQDREPAVRRAALESLGNASHADVPNLIAAAYDQGDRALQLSAVYAMGRSADTRWLPTIMDELTNPYSEMRIEAARAAGAQGASDLVQRLVSLLDDEELEVQLAAVGALGQIGSDQANEALSERLADADAYRLHEAIEEVLAEMEWLGSDIDFSLFALDEDNDLE